MLHTTINITPDYSKAGLNHSGTTSTLTTYILDLDKSVKGDYKRPLILVCPGGGYVHLSSREGEPIAVKMNALGYHACVLRYSLSPDTYPSQLLEAALAVRTIKEHAEEWNVDPDKICICGFSAGAHVAGSLGTMWNREILTKVLGGDSCDFRPAAQLLCYPVITSGEFAHRGSFTNLIEDKPELMDTVSLEKNVDDDTVPTFIWHTFEDQAVPVENSLLMSMALRRHSIPQELHIYERGRHGLALATEETNTLDGCTIQPECSGWPELFDTWYRNIVK